MRFFKVSFISLIVLSFFVLLAQGAYAQGSPLESIIDPLQGRFTSLGQIITLLLPSILILGGMVAFLFLIWGGFKYMTAQGDPKAISSARGTIISAVVGLIILVSIFAIMRILEGIFMIKILGSLAPPAYAGTGIGEQFTLGGRAIVDVFGNLGALVTSVVKFILALGGIVFFFMLIWGGIRYMSAQGDEKQISDARQTLTNAVIGLLIIVSSFAIIGIIALATGATLSIF